MGEKQVYEDPILIRYRGIYDYDGLLQLIRDFYSSVKMDIREPKFKHKGGGAAEVEFKFEGDRKTTHYIKVYLYVEGHFWDVNMQEMTIAGEKTKATNGKLELKINASFELDYPEMFDQKNKFHKWMKEKLDSPADGLQTGDVKTYSKKFCEQMVNKLAGQIKKHLNMSCA